MRLTDEHVRAFLDDGLVLIDDVLADDELTGASRGVDHLYATGERDNGIVGLFDEPGLLHILAHPNLEAIAKKMLNADHVVLNSAASLYRKPNDTSEWTLDPGEHVDIMFSLDEMAATPRRMLAMMMVFIEDLPPGRGNTWVRLGSHRRIAEHLQQNNLDPIKAQPTFTKDLPDLDVAELTPVVAKRGQVAAFTTALMHCGSSNIDTQPRKILFVNFSPRGLLWQTSGNYNRRERQIAWRQRLCEQFPAARRHLVASE